MSTRSRPLSPHLQIYRLPLLAIMSITHRVTGVALVAGLFVLAWWLGCAAAGPESFAFAQDLVGSWIGRLALFGWSVALFFHLGHGVRHLLWETGWGFDLPDAYASAYVSLGVTAGLTVAAWGAALLF
ncbi:succinate dehydrogenase, cytochrome b556 subunit [Magnetospirillum sp. UT-4]|uniref:succinate dehydrogenase, cytochrome b556 subunit n=1 Tax=Magnetospirillum sp. UT-4 TaxID=2681467 RepID=UPI00137C753F|nr:succinate dehydrogenase, cytochrome b556 subunit [Magnetospirillum sp. UT-4]CAA7623833.1 Succinate dehydrogenase cytochrome b556 subunit [Magnetospirillum sp. UT-4]